jgi:hypothetical protein
MLAGVRPGCSYADKPKSSIASAAHGNIVVGGSRKPGADSRCHDAVHWDD